MNKYIKSILKPLLVLIILNQTYDLYNRWNLDIPELENDYLYRTTIYENLKTPILNFYTKIYIEFKWLIIIIATSLVFIKTESKTYKNILFLYLIIISSKLFMDLKLDQFLVQLSIKDAENEIFINNYSINMQSYIMSIIFHLVIPIWVIKTIKNKV